ncbi:SDR family NAD(P)-dependent oxidoreductase [Staphylococcus gallinarum]|uniref:SDR family NAD(P)-dependent oxidoreductase n=1 Tax=Staphylococcus gallinarum TaxID=1293 RepID=UPI0022815A12|nr:SDR family NAD(P)-dependent oxidoreductase [Staphylococcus gallinarum]MDN6412745.1 SDR family NAD(P)-dependent oxidoreductase [Staphylococcus gallinarum]
MQGKHFILTGSTSGLGKALLKKLLANDINVTVLVRNPQKLNQFVAQYHTDRLSIIQCDLQSEKEICHITQSLQQQKIYGLIYCSGLGYFKSIEAHRTEEMLETYQLNIISFNILLEVIRPFFNKYPIIVGIGSQAAFVTQANAAHYGASKAAFYQTLNAIRLEHPNYHVLTVNTGPINTPFHQKADPSLNYAKRYNKIMINPDKLADRIFKAMKSKRQEINQPLWMSFMLKLYQLTPRFIEKHFSHFFKNKI